MEVVHAGTIHPGRYLVLVTGAVGDVEEALRAGLEVGERCLVDSVLLPNMHDPVVAALRGSRRAGTGEALGIVETATVAATIEAADAGVKGAGVALLELRLGDGRAARAISCSTAPCRTWRRPWRSPWSGSRTGRRAPCRAPAPPSPG